MRTLFNSLLAVLVFLASAAFAEGNHRIINEEIPNLRGGTSEIMLYYPDEPGTVFPLVVMAHGHGGELTEAGGFDAVAEGLVKAGIASVRIQFPGSGSSSESFTVNTISNMLDDLQTALDYALEDSAAATQLDAEAIAILGYSMGGRLAMLATAENPIYQAVALWAPAATDGVSSLYNLFGGADAFRAAWAEAELDGQHVFTTPWGGTQELSLAWFDELAASTPATAFAGFTGPVFVLYGDEDVVVDPAVARSAATAAVNSVEVTAVTIGGADHGFGFFDGFTKESEETVHETVNWLTEQLQ